MSNVERAWEALRLRGVAAVAEVYPTLTEAERDDLIGLLIVESELDGAEADRVVAAMVELRRRRLEGEGS